MCIFYKINKLFVKVAIDFPVDGILKSCNLCFFAVFLLLMELLIVYRILNCKQGSEFLPNLSFRFVVALNQTFGLLRVATLMTLVKISTETLQAMTVIIKMMMINVDDAVDDVDKDNDDDDDDDENIWLS